jgi:hypothetical protein
MENNTMPMSALEYVRNMIPTCIADRVECATRKEFHFRDHWGRKLTLQAEHWVATDHIFVSLDLSLDSDALRSDFDAFMEFKACLIVSEARNDGRWPAPADYEIVRIFGTDADRSYLERRRMFRKIVHGEAEASSSATEVDS